MLKTPFVSVGLPVFNGQKFLGKAIESILNQEYEEFELIISDNASTDATSDICRQYAKLDRRIRCYRSAVNIGGARNHNRVFHLAKGKYFKWAAHDDENRPEFLRRCVEVFNRAPQSVVLAYPQADLIDEDGALRGSYSMSIACDSPQPHVRLATYLMHRGLGTPMYGVVRSEALGKTRLLGAYTGSDYVLLAELAMLGRLYEVPGGLLRKRIHPGRSMEACANVAERMAWFDPQNVGGEPVLGVSDHLALEYLRSACYLSLGFREKVQCTSVVLCCTQQERANRWKRRLRQALHLKVQA